MGTLMDQKEDVSPAGEEILHPLCQEWGLGMSGMGWGRGTHLQGVRTSGDQDVSGGGWGQA